MTKYFEIKSKEHYPMLYSYLSSAFDIFILLIYTIFLVFISFINEEKLFFMLPLVMSILPIYFIFKEYYLNFEIKIVKEIKYDTEINNFLLLYFHKLRDSKKNIKINEIIEIERTKVSKRHFLSNLCRIQSIFIYTKTETFMIFYNNEQIKEIDEIYNDLSLMLDNYTKKK